MSRWWPAVLMVGAGLVAACESTTEPTTDLLGTYTAMEADAEALPVQWRPAVDLTGALLTIVDAPQQSFTLRYFLTFQDTTTVTPPDTTTAPPDTTTAPSRTGGALAGPAWRAARAGSEGVVPFRTVPRAAVGDSTGTCTVTGAWTLEGDALVVVDSTVTASGDACGPEVTIAGAADGVEVEADATEAAGGPFHSLLFAARDVAELTVSADSLLFDALDQTRAIHVQIVDQAGLPYDVQATLQAALEGGSVVALVSSQADSLVLRSIAAGQARLILLAGSQADTVGITVLE